MLPCLGYRKMDKLYTNKEELLNVLSHTIGVVGGCIVASLFIKKSLSLNLDFWGMTSVGLYLFGMLSSYVASVAYHVCAFDSVWKYRLRKLDHSAIYWHIAGSYSPIMLIAMRNVDYWGWGIFIFSWSCALVGTFVSFRGLKKHSNVETLCFVLMGLTIVIAMKQFWETVSIGVFLWIIGEGVAYIIGALFYSFHKIKYMHAVFHIFVLLGSVCHMMAVWYILQSV